MTRARPERPSARRRTVVGAALLVGTSLAGAGNVAAADPLDWVITDDKILGPLAIEPVKGDLVAPMEVTSSGSCPRGTHSITRMFGPRLPAGGVNVIGNSAIHLYGTPPGDTMHAAWGITLDDVGRSLEPPVVLEGIYRVVMNCQIKILTDPSEAYAFYVGEIRIRGRGYTSLTTLKDLPKQPVATPGPEAVAYREQALQGPLAAEPTAAKAASADSSGSPAAAVLVTVAIVAVVGGAVAFSANRSRSRQPHPSDSRT